MIEMSVGKRMISGFLIDLDGVLYIGKRPIGGAVEFINRLVSLQIPFRYITNTTRKSKVSLRKQLQKMGFPVEDNWVFSAASATVQFLKAKNVKDLYLITGGDVYNDFAGFNIRDDEVDVVVMGDPGKEVTFDLLNRGFQLLMNGAQLIAMQKNRYWKTEEGYVMDAGAFVVSLEFTAGKEATVVGKPSKEFFSLALESLNLPNEQVAMIGDDVETDILGASQNGLAMILVKTGKYLPGDENRFEVEPDIMVDSIANLISLLPG